MLACFSGTPSISDQLVGAANGRTSFACETLTGLYVNHSTHKLTNTSSGIALCANSASPQNKSPVLPQTHPSQTALCASLASPQNKSPVLPQTHPSQTTLLRQFRVPPKQKSCPSTNTSQPNRAMRQFGVPSKHPSRLIPSRSSTILPTIYILHNLSLCAILKPVKTTKTT